MNGIAMAVDALTEVTTRDGPVIVARLDGSQELDMLPLPVASEWPERRKKKCEKCHKWTGGADHYCKRGLR